MAIVNLKKNQFPIFIDISSTATRDWALIGFATEQSVAMNPQTEDVDYISYENAVSEVRSNAIEIPTNLALKQGDEAFDFVYDKFISRPTGTACEVDILVCFPKTSSISAWECIDSTLLLGSLSPANNALDFSLKPGGVINDGTVVITAGVPVFTKAT